MQSLPIEQRRVRFALISAFFAGIKALSGRGDFRLRFMWLKVPRRAARAS